MESAWLRVWMLRSLLGEREEANAEFAKHLRSLHGMPEEDILPVIGRFVAGEIREAQLIRSARLPANTGEAANLALCRASFYAGVVRLLAGDRPGAESLFQQALGTNARGCEDYTTASAMLASLKKL